jgi:hypothetical protein
MGCQFNFVIVPAKIQKDKDLQKYYEDYQEKLMKEYGEEFEGYSGDMAVDDGSLIIKKELKTKVSKQNLTQKDFDLVYDDLLKLCEGHCEKWGPSIAVRINDQWAICGAYSD